jgi:high-affinity nickel-transport protein
MGIVLGLVVGLRHAFEPDHLTAVSTLVGDASDGRRGALVGAIWGIGPSLSLVIVGLVLMVLGATLSPGAAAVFECAVSDMLIALGGRAIVGAFRADRGPVTAHHHGRFEHAHGQAMRHFHAAGRVVAWRPLVVGLVHGLAGSGALTAVVFAELPTAALRLVYITLFGLGSVAGMAAASGLAGRALQAMARQPGARRSLAMIAGAASIIVGLVWAIPVIAALVQNS